MGQHSEAQRARRLRIWLATHVVLALAALGAALAVLPARAALPWPLVWLLLALPLHLASSNGFVPPSKHDAMTRSYTPAGPFLLAGALLLPALPLAALAFALREHGGRFRWFNRLRRVIAMLTAASYWSALGPGGLAPEDLRSKPNVWVALATAVAVYGVLSLGLLSLSFWYVGGIPPSRQDLWVPSSLFPELWELPAGAAGALLVLESPATVILLGPGRLPDARPRPPA